MMNQDQILGIWKEFKSGVRNLWGQITDDELESTRGNISQISGIIQQKYGETKATVQDKMDRLMTSFENDTDLGGVKDRASFERNPVQPRTSEKSQTQDSIQGLKSGSKERRTFDNEAYEASQESLRNPSGSSSHSEMN